jgi:hypothetical protein
VGWDARLASFAPVPFVSLVMKQNL